MTRAIEDRIEAYLDGELEPDQTAEVERALARPEVARILSQALMVRELLRTAPPELPPSGLVDEIHAAVQAQLAEVAADRDDETGRRLRFPRLRAALFGASWGLRGPALAVASSGAGRTALDGLATMRSALGPLASRVGLDAAAATSKPGQRSDKKAKKEAKKANKARKKAMRARKKSGKKGGGLLRRLLRRG